MNRRYLLAAIFLSALLLRLLGLNWGLPTKTFSLTTYHPDESYVFQAFQNIYETRSLHPGRIGLLYGTFHFYICGFLLFLAKLFGFIEVGGRDFLLSNLQNLDRMYLTLRLFSALCGALAVVGIYHLGRRFYNERIGILSAFFLAFYPIAIAVSHYAKVDAVLPLLVVILLWCSLHLLENPTLKNAFWGGLIVGLLASTRYNAGIFIFTPLAASFICSSEKKAKLAGMVLLSSAVGFFSATPYALLDFPLFFSCLYEQIGMLGGGGVWEAGRGSGFVRYLAYYFPFGIGWISWGLALMGLAILFAHKGKEKKDWILFVAFFSFFLLIGKAAHRQTSFLTALLPFTALFSAIGFEFIREIHLGRFLKGSLLSILILIHLLYGISFARLYSKLNTREAAQDWLIQTVPTTESVGIIRSYFWTPGLLRQSHPPYPLIKASDDRTGFHLSALRLASLKIKPAYFVASELETREYLRARIIFAKQADALEQFFSDYILVQQFELKPEIAGIPFWHRTAPWDFAMIAPAMKIYKRKNSLN